LLGIFLRMYRLILLKKGVALFHDNTATNSPRLKDC